MIGNVKMMAKTYKQIAATRALLILNNFLGSNAAIENAVKEAKLYIIQTSPNVALNHKKPINIVKQNISEIILLMIKIFFIIVFMSKNEIIIN